MEDVGPNSPPAIGKHGQEQLGEEDAAQAQREDGEGIPRGLDPLVVLDAELARDERDEEVAHDAGDVEDDEDQHEPMLGSRVYEPRRRDLGSVISGPPIPGPVLCGSTLLVSITGITSILIYLTCWRMIITFIVRLKVHGFLVALVGNVCIGWLTQIGAPITS